MILTPHELQDPIWLRLKEHYQARLADLRKQNDSAKLNEIETARLRGRIEECKKFLSLSDPKPDIDE